MGYAKRLVEMSRRSGASTIAPTTASTPAHATTDAPTHATVEAPTDAATDTAAAAAATVAANAAIDARDEAAQLRRRASRPANAAERAPSDEALSERAPMERPRWARSAEPTLPRAATPAVDAAVRVPAAVPPTSPAIAPWLADRADRADPLDALPTSDELRDVLRAVRRWTSAPPIAPPNAIDAPAAPPEAPAVVDEPAIATRPEHVADGHHVSIDNVTITVDDAPASRTRAAPSRDTSSRLARHYIRGG